MCAAQPVPLDERQLLFDFLSGCRKARDRLPRVMASVLRRQARRIAPDLPPDLLGDIVQEALTRLLTVEPTRFDPSKGSARTFLALVVWDAARRVRADYAPPAMPTRRRGPDAPPVLPAPPIDDRPVADPLAAAAFAGVEHRHDAAVALAAAPSPLADALKRLAYASEPMTDVAKRMGLERTALHHRFRAFGRALLQAAA